MNDLARIDAFSRKFMEIQVYFGDTVDFFPMEYFGVL